MPFVLYIEKKNFLCFNSKRKVVRKKHMQTIFFSSFPLSAPHIYYNKDKRLFQQLQQIEDNEGYQDEILLR